MLKYSCEICGWNQGRCRFFRWEVPEAIMYGVRCPDHAVGAGTEVSQDEYEAVEVLEDDPDPQESGRIWRLAPDNPPWRLL